MNDEERGCLVLSRRPGESVVIVTSDGEIEIIVKRGEDSNRMRLVFLCDKKIPIHRMESYDPVTKGRKT